MDWGGDNKPEKDHEEEEGPLEDLGGREGQRRSDLRSETLAQKSQK